jgi:hypothetical protein
MGAVGKVTIGLPFLDGCLVSAWGPNKPITGAHNSLPALLRFVARDPYCSPTFPRDDYGTINIAPAASAATPHLI